MITDLTKAVLVLLAVVCTALPILYTVWFKWHQTRLGRALFFQSLALALVIVHTVLRQMYGVKLDGVRLGLFSFLLFTQAGVLFEMIKIKTAGHGTNGLKEREHG